MSNKYFAVCDENTEGAVPLYDKINGSECLYVTEKSCDDETLSRISEEMGGYELEKVLTYDDASFRGFVAGMSYDEGVRAERCEIDAAAAVVKDGELAGIAVNGSFYSWWGYRSDPLDTAREYERMIFLPIDGEYRETDYYRSVTVYGSDGEEDDYTRYTNSALRKKESN